MRGEHECFCEQRFKASVLGLNTGLGFVSPSEVSKQVLGATQAFSLSMLAHFLTGKDLHGNVTVCSTDTLLWRRFSS